MKATTKYLIVFSILMLIAVFFGINHFLYSAEWQMRSAIKHGDHMALLKYLDNGYDPNLAIQDFDNRKSNRSLLHFAIEKGDYESARILLDHGANPNSIAYGGVTPLMFVLCMGGASESKIPFLKLLIPITNFAQKDSLGQNVLHYAATYGTDTDYDMIKSLQPMLALERDSSGDFPEADLNRRHRWEAERKMKMGSIPK